MNKPELPPNYEIQFHVDDAKPYQLRSCGHGWGFYAERSEAVDACWDHWREHGDPVWVEYLEAATNASTEDFDRLKKFASEREPFTGFEEVTDEQRAVAQAEADRNADSFAAAKMSTPTADEVIFAAHLQQFAVVAQHEPGAKASKLVHAIFDDRSPQGQACSLMLAQLVTRLYRSPYPGLNSAGVDFINVLVPVIAVAFSGLKKSTPKSTPKRGMAKGKRPS